jgi:2-methylaconitate cis-trans-isomerase PrpF
LDLPQFEMAGVPGLASKIVMDFPYPSGSRTGKLLPAGSPTVTLELNNDIMGSTSRSITASLVDAAIPSVLVLESDVKSLLACTEIDYTLPNVLSVLEEIRQAGTIRMGLDPKAQAAPKIAILSPNPSQGGDIDSDIVVRALSMGILHKAVPMTVGLCIGVAAGIHNTIARNIFPTSKMRSDFPFTQVIRISHPTGTVEVGAEFESEFQVKSAKVFRTGKRLMRGEVYW